MKELLKEYFNMLSENLVSTLNTPDAYLNKLAVTTILIIIGVLLHILVKSIIKSNVNIKEIKIKLNKISRNSIIILVILFILFI